LTDSRQRANPASSRTNPTCMPNTRNAATSVQTVLIALTVAIGSSAGVCVDDWAPSIAGRNHRVMSVSTMASPIALPRKRSPTCRRISGFCQFVRKRSPTLRNLLITAFSSSKKVSTPSSGLSPESVFSDQRQLGCAQPQRLPLHFLGSHRRERGVVSLTCANANDAIERLHEALPVAHGPGARGADDGVDRRLDERLRARHLDLDLFVKLQEQLRPASHRHGVLLSAVTAGARDGDSGDAGAEQRFFDGRKAVGADDTANEFHCSPRATVRVDRAIKQKIPRVHRSKRGGLEVMLWSSGLSTRNARSRRTGPVRADDYFPD